MMNVGDHHHHDDDVREAATSPSLPLLKGAHQRRQRRLWEPFSKVIMVLKVGGAQHEGEGLPHTWRHDETQLISIPFFH